MLCRQGREPEKAFEVAISHRHGSKDSLQQRSRPRRHWGFMLTGDDCDQLANGNLSDLLERDRDSSTRIGQRIAMWGRLRD